MRKRILLISILAVILSTYSSAQVITELHSSLLSETTSLPFGKYTPIHPGSEIGATVWKEEFSSFSISSAAFAGTYYHRKQENAVYVRAEFLASYPLFNSINIGIPLGGGYLHSIYPGNVYEQNSETGIFEPSKRKYRAFLCASMGVYLGYTRFEKITPFVRHDFTIDFPFGNYFMRAHSILKIGTTFSIN